MLETNWRANASLYGLYTRLGHEVYVIKPFSTELINWKNSVVWPCLLAWSKENPNVTNFEYHGFDKVKEFPFGEDNFLILEDFVRPVIDKSVTVKLVDIENENNFFDAVHIFPHFYGDWLDNAMTIVEKYCKNAKIINSSFDPGSLKDRILMFENSCEFLPAMYDGMSKQMGIENSVGFIRSKEEIEILGIDFELHRNDWRSRRNISSFMHNFKQRQTAETEEYFHKLAEYAKINLNCKLENFGGNIRGQGADLKHSGNNGITGNYTTLSPRSSFKEFFKSRGILHLKHDDWAGGCEIGARASCCPMIIYSGYFSYTKLSRTWGEISSKSLFAADSPESIIGVIAHLLDDEKCEKSRNEIYENNSIIFSDDYYNGWKLFLDNLK